MLRDSYKKSLRELDLTIDQKNQLIAFLESQTFSSCRTLALSIRDGILSANRNTLVFINGTLLEHDVFEENTLSALLDTPKVRAKSLPFTSDERRALTDIFVEFIDNLSLILSDEQLSLFVKQIQNLTRPVLFEYQQTDMNWITDELLGKTAYSVFLSESFIKSKILF
jgi:hypothetical protein